MAFPPLLKHRWITRLLWLVAAVLLLWGLSWLAVPPLLKSQIQKAGSEALGRTVTVGAVDFKPWTLELTLTDIQVATADGKGTQLAIPKIYVDAEMQSLWRLGAVVDAITIDQPHVSVTHLGDGHYDIDDILQRFQSDSAKPTSEPPRFALYNVVLSQGSVDFTDHRNGAEHVHTLRKLDLSLPFLSSFDSQREVTVAPYLAFELNGSTFDSAAQATPFAADAQGDGSLRISHLDIAPYLPYLPASLPVRLKAAVMDSSLKLTFVQKPERRLVVSGAIDVSGIQVDDKAGSSLLAAQSLKAVISELRPLENKLDLASLTVTAPKLAVSRDRNGKLNLLPGEAKGETRTAEQPKAAEPAAAAPAWQVALAHFNLNGGEVRWSDATVSPTAQLMLGDTQIDVRDVHWPFAEGAKPVPFEASAALQVVGAKNAKPAHIAVQGEGTDSAGTAKATVSDLGLDAAAPYLSPFLVPKANGVLEGEVSANWKGSDVQVQAKRLALRDFALTAPPGQTDIAAKDMPSFKLLELSDVAVDLAKRTATLGKLNLQKPSVRVARGEDGQWMFSRWLPASAAAAPVAKSSAASNGSKLNAATKAPSWTVTLADVGLDQGTVTYVDRVPAKPVFLELSNLQTRVKSLGLDGKKPAPVSLSAKVRTARAEPGSLRFDGSLMWDPLVAQGKLEAVQFPAQALAPYGMSRLRASLLRADTSFKGNLRYAALPAGADVSVQGDAAVEELRLNSDEKTASGAAVSEELLNWKALSLPGIDFRMLPGKPINLKLREVSLSDFFARLIVNAEGRLVLQDLVVADDAATTTTSSTTTTTTTKATEPTATATPSVNDPIIEVGAVRLVNGHVAFSDRFIKPNYSADLTDLSGSLSRFSSQQPQTGVQMADLELRGRAEGTASLEIAGKVNPLAKPLALDVTAKMRDLELSPLSSYSAKYSGYGIERGKLSADLHYAVSPDGKLEASNQLTLNQLVFGDAVPGAPNSLPVKLAVALLADRNGVIDLNVPLSGSLNDPEFRVWPIVWKIIGNLVTKALVSPFSLISGIFSGNQADELSTVAFEPGSARISPAALPGLDKVATALRDKEQLSLTVVGTASLEREQGAMQKESLNALLLAEKRRQAASDGQDVTAVTAFTPEEYPALLAATYKRSNVKKPRNLVGMAKDISNDEMQALLLQSLPVNEDAVRELALNRGLAVREYLTAHQVPSARLFLGAVNTAPTAPDWQARVELNLEHH